MIRLLPLFVLSAAAFAQTPQNPPKPDSQNPHPETQKPSTQTPPKPDAGRQPGDVQITTPGTKSDAKSIDGFLATWLVVDGNNEIALSQLAQQKATDPEVKQFAQKMITDHQQMVQKLQPFAVGVGATTTGAIERVPDQNRPLDASFATGGFDHVGLIQDLGEQCLQTARRELEQKQGAEFDRCYMAMQVGGHLKANDMLTVFQQHSSASLKPALGEAQRAVSSHIQEAKTLAKKMEGKTATTGAK